MATNPNITHKRWLRSYATIFGIAIPRGFRVNENWGEAAQTLTRRVQQHMRKPLTGTFTDDMVIPCKSADIRLATWKMAHSQVGVEEHGGDNRGKEVEAYLAATGLGGGYPWCAAFQTWCFKNAGWSGTLPEYSAYCPSWESWATAKGFVIPFAKARKGDFVTFNWNADSEADHIGIVTRRAGTTLLTIEGNTSSTNWSDGDGVFECSRDKKYVSKIIRVSY